MRSPPLPCGGIDQGEALDCGQVRLTLAEHCQGVSPSITLGDSCPSRTSVPPSKLHHLTMIQSHPKRGEES